MINLIAPVNPTSYGICGNEISEQLAIQSPESSLFIIGANANTTVSANQMRLLQNAAFFKDVPSVRLWHQHDMSMFVGKGKRIGFSIFELNRFTDIELHHLKSVDELIVATSWAKSVLIDNGIKSPIHVVPLGVRTDQFKVAPIFRTDNTVFFCPGKFEVRKLHDKIFDIFKRAFPKNERVHLMMFPTNPFLTHEETQEFANRAQDNRISLFPRMPLEDMVYKLSIVDCCLAVSRAEGWNLPALEMLSMGKHVIATNYSGHTEFLNSENSRLIDIDKLESAVDNKWFFGAGDWAHFGPRQEEQLIHHMREIHRLKSEGRLMVNEAGVNTAQQFTWERTVREMLNVSRE